MTTAVKVPTDIEIAQAAKLRPIADVAAELGLADDEVEFYGRYKAKISLQAIERRKPTGRLVLVTGINPTPAGEGKSTVTVGVAQALRKLGKRALLCIREPSLGPVFGVKGGAAGGGYAQVVPMEDINLHFTGDFHAIASAHNLLSAMLDAHLHHGNALGLDTRRITWPRTIDMNDRALRQIIVGLGGMNGGPTREERFVIIPGSEVMAIMALATSLADLETRLARIIVGLTGGQGRRPRFGPEGARGDGAAAQGRVEAEPGPDARGRPRPGALRTVREHRPRLQLGHGDPAGPAARGCGAHRSGIRGRPGGGEVLRHQVPHGRPQARGRGRRGHRAGTQDARRQAKRISSARPTWRRCSVASRTSRGTCANVKQFGVPCVVALNCFISDTEEEIEAVRSACAGVGVDAVRCEVWEKGGEGGKEVAQAVLGLLEGKSAAFKPLYDERRPIAEKIETIAKEIYGAAAVSFAPAAQRAMELLPKLGLGETPVCMAKTQYSFSDDPTKLGAPSGYTLQVRDVLPSAGAGFVVALAGEIMTMPGLGKSPAAERIRIHPDGTIEGLF